MIQPINVPALYFIYLLFDLIHRDFFFENETRRRITTKRKTHSSSKFIFYVLILIHNSILFFFNFFSIPIIIHLMPVAASIPVRTYTRKDKTRRVSWDIDPFWMTFQFRTKIINFKEAKHGMISIFFDPFVDVWWWLF